MKKAALAPLLLTLSLVGCGGWWGESEAPPLEGTRLPVLVYDQQTKVDADALKTDVTLPAATAEQAWASSGGTADHAGGHYALGNALKEAWSADSGSGLSRDYPMIATPVVVGDVIFTMDSGTDVRAFSTTKGKKLWERDVEPKGKHDKATGGGLAFEKGKLVAATGFGEVVALDPANGNVLWRSDVKSPLRSAPTLAQGLIFVVTIDNKLLALSAETGTVQWQHAGIIETAGLLGAPSPAVFGDMVLVAYSSGELFALSTLNGREQWADSLATARREGGVLSIAAIRGQPVLAANGVAALAISNSGRLVAIDTRSGQRVWDQRLSGNQMPWVAGNVIFVVTAQAQLVSLNLNDGKIRWVQQLGQWEDTKNSQGVIAWYGPVLAGGKLWLTNSRGHLMGYDPATGAEQVKIKLDSPTNRPPVVAGETLYTLDDDATLTAWR